MSWWRCCWLPVMKLIAANGRARPAEAAGAAKRAEPAVVEEPSGGGVHVVEAVDAPVGRVAHARARPPASASSSACAMFRGGASGVSRRSSSDEVAGSAPARPRGRRARRPSRRRRRGRRVRRPRRSRRAPRRAAAPRRRRRRAAQGVRAGRTTAACSARASSSAGRRRRPGGARARRATGPDAAG